MNDMIKKVGETYAKNMEDFLEELSGEKRFNGEELSEEQVKGLEFLINSQSCTDHDFEVGKKVLFFWTSDLSNHPVIRRTCKKCGITQLYDVKKIQSEIESTGNYIQ